MINASMRWTVGLLVLGGWLLWWTTTPQSHSQDDTAAAHVAALDDELDPSFLPDDALAQRPAFVPVPLPRRPQETQGAISAKPVDADEAPPSGSARIFEMLGAAGGFAPRPKTNGAGDAPDSYGDRPPETPAEVRDRWSNEGADPSWSASMNSHLTEAFADLDVNGDVQSTECKQTVCRVNLRFNGTREALRFREQAVNAKNNRHLTFRQEGQDFFVEAFVPRPQEQAL